MPMRKKTLRRMPANTRRLAKLIGELDSVSRRLKNILPVVEDMERWIRAEEKRKQLYPENSIEEVNL